MRDHPLPAVIREAAAAARSQIVISALLMMLIAGTVIAIAGTAGQAAAAQRQVLNVIDREDTRTITVRARLDADLRADLVTQVSGFSGVEWVVGLGPAQDGYNANGVGRRAVGVRRVYSSSLDPLRLSHKSPIHDAAYVDEAAKDLLGLADSVGAVNVGAGLMSYPVVGAVNPPATVTRGEAVVFVPSSATNVAPLVGLTVQADSPDRVAPLLRAITTVVVSRDPSQVTIESSSRVAALRASIEEDLARFGRGLLLLILAASAALTALILAALVQLRRRDFGRRRALGATRGMVIGLLLTQVVLLVALGEALGIAIVVLTSTVRGADLPGWDFFLSTGYLILFTAVLAAIVPAVFASRRDPLKELRTP